MLLGLMIAADWGCSIFLAGVPGTLSALLSGDLGVIGISTAVPICAPEFLSPLT